MQLIATQRDGWCRHHAQPNGCSLSMLRGRLKLHWIPASTTERREPAPRGAGGRCQEVPAGSLSKLLMERCTGLRCEGHDRYLVAWMKGIDFVEDRSPIFSRHQAILPRCLTKVTR